jgi:dynein assembly factor 2
MKDPQTKTVQDPGEEILKQTLRKQMSNHESKNISNDDNKVNLTKEEFHRIEKAFEDKEFRNLMADYVSEISDPKHRAEQDEYIRQLEEQNDIPQGKGILRPEPGFVMKLKFSKRKKKEGGISSNGSEKMFVNIVHSKEVGQPVYAISTVKDRDGKSGRHWSIPYTLGPMRMEADNKKSLVPTCDCCFHPLTLIYASKNTAYRDLIATTVIEGVTGQFKAVNEVVEIEKNYLVLKGIQYKNGKPPPMMIDKEKSFKSSTTAALSLSSSSKYPTENKTKKEKIQENTGNSSTTTSCLSKGFLLKESKSRKKKCNDGSSNIDKQMTMFDKGGGKTKDGEVIPYYEIIERKEFDLADHNNIEGLKKPSSRPKTIIIRIRLPGIHSTKSVDIDVSEERLVLKCPRPDNNYSLSIKLPYPVSSDEGTAKFDKESHTLTVTLPVIRPDVDTTFSVGQDHGEMIAPTPKKMIQEEYESVNTSPVIVVATNLEESPVMVEKPHIDHSRWLSDDNKENLREAFASDDIIPVCETLQQEQNDIDKGKVSTNSEKVDGDVSNHQKESDGDDFQVVEHVDCEEVDDTGENKENSRASSFYCNSKFAFELD